MPDVLEFSYLHHGLLDSHVHNFVYVAPGEELTEQHFDQLRGGYAKEVTVPCA
jgi:hypothetical protein